MKRIQFFLISLMVLAAGNLRAQEAYTVLKLSEYDTPDLRDEYTLTYYFDNNKASWEGRREHSIYVFPLSTSTNFVELLNPWYLDHIVTVTFDDSFANYRELIFFNGMFANYTELKEIKGIQNLNTSHATTMRGMFYKCWNLTELDVSHFDTKNVTDMGSMFMETYGLRALDLKNFDTKNVVNMSSMFQRCGARDLDVSNFDTRNVTDMQYMFSYCRANILDVSNFNTQNVTQMSGMFEGVDSVVGLKALDTSNVIGMVQMFRYYRGKNLDLSSFDTSNVQYMYDMFAGFKGESIDLSSFDTSKVNSMCGMFCMATNLRSLDLSSFDTSNVECMSRMFYGANYLEKIYVSDGWNMECTLKSRLHQTMFGHCSSLTGGLGTKYDEKHINGLYARIDGGESSPGYFTKKLPASINNSIVQEDAIDKYYKLDGVSDRRPAKGLNILRMSDGRVKKVLVK